MSHKLIMSRKARNTNVSVSVLSRTDKQQIDSFVVKPRDIVGKPRCWDLITRSSRQSARAQRPKLNAYSFIHSFIPAISIAPLQVLYYSEALPTTTRILYRSSTPKRTGNCRLDQRWRTYGTRAQSGTREDFAWHAP